MGLIPIDQVVTAQGIVVSQSPTILVQPLETAIVRSIDVREGQTVKAGQVLAQLDPTFAAADVGALRRRSPASRPRSRACRRKPSGKPFTYTGAIRRWRCRRRSSPSARRSGPPSSRTIDQKIDELEATVAQGCGRPDVSASACGGPEDRGMRKELEAKQVGTSSTPWPPPIRGCEIQRGLASAQNEAPTARKRDLEAHEAERDGYMQNWNAEVSQKLVGADPEAQRRRGNLNKAQLRRNLVELRADRDAIVQSVAKVSVGSVLQSGQQFITLVPVDAPLEVEANIARPGQWLRACRRSGLDQVRHLPLSPNTAWPRAPCGPSAPTASPRSTRRATRQARCRCRNSTEPFYRTRIAIDKLGLQTCRPAFT